MTKYSAELKIAACKDYLDGELSAREICQKYGISFNESKSTTVLTEWVAMYLKQGEKGFIKLKGNKAYLREEKIHIVEEYLAGKGSIRELCAEYGIPSKENLRRWILLYNANIELEDYIPKREVYMAKARRKTTLEERVEIVEYCLSHNRDYKGTASVYNVSYNQVYTWVRKHDKNGEEGLTDRRGHHKADSEVDELERIRRENKRLKRQLEEKDMLVELLKKVKEFEGM